MVKRCGTDVSKHYHQQKKLNVNDVKKMAIIDDDGRTFNIGVVTHIMYQNPNIPQVELDVAYSIKTLNEDFNKQAENFNNGESVYANTPFEGVYNDYVGRAGSYNFVFFPVQTIYKPLPPLSDVNTYFEVVNTESPPVQANRYLNVYVADLLEDPEAGSILGIAVFPWEHTMTTDGVIVNTLAYGLNAQPPFNLNKTLSHEVGHWIGLFHTFQETLTPEEYGDGDFPYLPPPLTPEQEEQLKKGDLVPDTPPQGEPTIGNPYDDPTEWPTFQAIDEPVAFPSMFMNIMDYTDDNNLFMFTSDNVKRGRQAILLYRPDIANAPICVGKYTKVLMADNTEKEIWQIERGDYVCGDLKKKTIHKVAKVIRRKISADTRIRVVEINKGSLGFNMPNTDLLMTASHPIVWNDVRTRAKNFSHWDGVKFHKDVSTKEILPVEDDGTYVLYDLIFEDNGYYIANGLTVQSHSPCCVIEPLEEKLYFSKEKCERNKNGQCPDYPHPMESGPVDKKSKNVLRRIPAIFSTKNKISRAKNQSVRLYNFE
jgi:hypothetical protein